MYRAVCLKVARVGLRTFAFTDRLRIQRHGALNHTITRTKCDVVLCADASALSFASSSAALSSADSGSAAEDGFAFADSTDLRGCVSFLSIDVSDVALLTSLAPLRISLGAVAAASVSPCEAPDTPLSKTFRFGTSPESQCPPWLNTLIRAPFQLT